MRRLLPFLPLLTASLPALAQVQGNVRDNPIPMVQVTASYAYQLPAGTMMERFGANNNIGLGAVRKFKSNYALGVEGSFLFGNKVNEPGLLNGLLTSDDQILDKEGIPATVFLYERGYTVIAVASKLLPVAGPNPNSGLLLKFGAGYMRHKIRFETQQNEVPQLEGEYLKGYDRLCAGPVLLLFAGYQHISSNRLVNFQIGFETMLGLTSPLRPYNFDARRADEGVRNDLLHGIRLGWTLPIYRRSDDAFYIR